MNTRKNETKFVQKKKKQLLIYDAWNLIQYTSIRFQVTTFVVIGLKNFNLRFVLFYNNRHNYLNESTLSIALTNEVHLTIKDRIV